MKSYQIPKNGTVQKTKKKNALGAISKSFYKVLNGSGNSY